MSRFLHNGHLCAGNMDFMEMTYAFDPHTNGLNPGEVSIACFVVSGGVSILG